MSKEKTYRLPVKVWLLDRLENCLRIAQTKSGDDCDGWLEDAAYFHDAICAIPNNEAPYAKASVTPNRDDLLLASDWCRSYASDAIDQDQKAIHRVADWLHSIASEMPK